MLLGVVAIVIAVVVVAALREAGSPTQARQRKLDERRVDDLRALASALRTRTSEHHALPPRLADLTEKEVLDHRADPVTHAPYGYWPLADSGFALGTRFDLAQEQDELDFGDSWWAHGAGPWKYQFNAGRVSSLPDSSSPAGPR